MQRLVLSLLLFTSPTLFADKPADGSEEKAKWEVSSDQYHTSEINIDTTETTWSKALQDAGVRVNIGAHGQREGLAAHWEMWSMVQGGFSPWEALRGATIDGAASLGMDHEIGSIETGKLADITIVDGNPLEDIYRSEYVSHTVINGRLYEAATMNQVVPDKTARQPLFFELEGGDAWSSGARQSHEEKAKALNWQH